MCGFVGVFHNQKNNEMEKILKKMTDTIIHRGPDSSGYYMKEDVSIGFRRLSIIDLSSDGKQPMLNEDGTVAIAFNGEIYNYKELREKLIEEGHTFKSKTDSEVLIHGYEEYGMEILDKVRGMFAFVLVDHTTNEYYLVRDFFGIKPLYYSQNTTDDSLIFGSEIKSFLEYPGFNKVFNSKALKPYLTFQYPVLEETFFKGVYKLKPGHYLKYSDGDLSMHSFWDNEFNSEEKSFDYYVKEISETLKASVDYHRISDVDVGSFLSGGVDSSYITSLLKPSKTFSVGFDQFEAMFNETNLAKELSDIMEIDNYSQIISSNDVIDTLSTIQYHMDEPQSNPSVVPLFFLAKMASEHVTVVLSGEGADEIFGGYLWYQKSEKQKKYELLPQKLRRGVSNLCKGLPTNQLTNFLVKGGQSIEEKYIGEAIVFPPKIAEKILKEPYKKSDEVSAITNEYYKKVSDKDDLTKMQYLDMHLWLPRDILLKADKMSMAHSIELRVPFLDREVMGLAKRIPSNYKVNSKGTKLVLREAARKELPDEWAERKKLGFPVPIRYWLREEQYYDRVKSIFSSEMAAQFFETEMLLDFLQEHYDEVADHGRYIWTVLTFLLWYEEFFIIR